LSSPPPDWSAQRKREYFEWARDVISGLSSPNKRLKEEFDQTYARYAELPEG
jgi:guanosine-3',5'-bis(diphosphate) 3'-pyrophosphohydrolase